MANYELKDRGSRKHLLDLISTPGFPQTVNSMLARTGFRLADVPLPQPHGRTDRNGWAEFEVKEYLSVPARQIGGLPPVAPDWWIVHKTDNNRRPCFDLLARLRSLVDDGEGLLLVEAKAHSSEAKIEDSKGSPSTSAASLDNDARIKRRVRETRTILNRLGCGTTHLDTNSHYQLAKRLAYSAHLASLGYCVVLLYLGFYGDTYFRDPLSDRDHWQRVVGGYFQGALPQALPERWHRIGPGRLYLAIDALPVREISMPPGKAPAPDDQVSPTRTEGLIVPQERQP